MVVTAAETCFHVRIHAWSMAPSATAACRSTEYGNALWND